MMFVKKNFEKPVLEKVLIYMKASTVLGMYEINKFLVFCLLEKNLQIKSDMIIF